MALKFSIAHPALNVFAPVSEIAEKAGAQTQVFANLLVNPVRLLGAFPPLLFFFRKVLLPLLIREVFPENLCVLLETSYGLFVQRAPAHIAAAELGTANLEFVFFNFISHVSLPDLYLTPSERTTLKPAEGGQPEFLLLEDNHYWIEIKVRMQKKKETKARIW
jgi:hypothetical protein